MKRVYAKHGSWWFVDTAGKWHKLTRTDAGEDAMLRALAKLRGANAERPGSMGALRRGWWEAVEAHYAPSTRADYELMFPKIERAFDEFQVKEIQPADVHDFIYQWKDKPRTAKKYLHILSMMFAHACAPLRLRADNPCREVKSPDLGPKRDRYITHEEFHRIRRGAMKGKDGRSVASGEMIVCAIDLAYLTFQRQAEIRALRWTDMDDDWLYFKPEKTKSTTGAKVRWRRTPELDLVLERARKFGKVKGPTVIHTLRGRAYSKSGIETAWSRACERAGVVDAHFHDLRAKAQTDARRAGYTMQAIQEGAAHADLRTTEGYIKRREIAESSIEMAMPKLDSLSGS